ncbi:stabilin-2-like protein [Labeo rohita]|uniref:Stabilin-2-like protein n=1 Tax=Labeo rohita TaxID=84645 RepID=A0A498NER3_LABRO|nr:stabilin-2-like protein [Labeo rohita]
MENNTCVCKPFYEGDGITCTAADMCKYWNGGCSKDAKCSQKGEKVTCTCLKGYTGDGFVCTPVDSCADGENGGCHEHAICIMTGAGKRKCDCKDNYIGDGIECEAKQLPVNRCLQDNGQCHSDAQCTDLHYEDKTLGVFHYRSPIGTYKLNYTMAQEACKEAGGTIATYTQLSYAQQAGYNLCAAGWLDRARVAYPMSFSNPKCGFGHVGIVDYGVRSNLSETWDTFCYRVRDVKCECKIGYIGDGYSCTGNLLQVLSARPTLSNFLSQILNYSTSASGKEFVNRLSNITIQSTLFAPDNDGLLSNQTLSGRDIEHHLLDGRALVLQALINITHVRTRLGHSLTITGVPDLQNPQIMTSSGYINDRYVTDSDILASNGFIHVLQGPLKAPPPPPPSFHPAHKAGMGIGVLGLIILIVAAGFVGYNFYTHKTKPFQFHYFKEDEDLNPPESSQNISNPVYDALPATKEQTPEASDSNNKGCVLPEAEFWDVLDASLWTAQRFAWITWNNVTMLLILCQEKLRISQLKDAPKILRYHIVACHFQIQKEQDKTPDTDMLKLVMDPIHQPVTLFLPTDAVMATLAQEQKDFLYAMHNHDKLLPSEPIHASFLKCQQGSDLSVACMGEDRIVSTFGEEEKKHLPCAFI